MIITSSSNPKIKEIRKLRERKYQKKTGLFYMEGLRIVGEALDKNADMQTLIACPDLIKNEFAGRLIQKAREQSIEILEVDESVFQSIALKDNPQGICAIGRASFSALTDIDHSSGLAIALMEVADPGNLGTIIRTADAVAASAVMLLGDCASPYDHNAIRASMGAVFSQKIVLCEFSELLDWKRTYRVQMVGTSDCAATDYLAPDYQNPAILLMGSERQGLTDEEMSACDEMARIPMMRSSDSLNLAVATGIMAYQIFNVQQGRIRR